MFSTFGGMLHIYTYEDEILVEQYFVTLVFDKAEVEDLIVKHCGEMFFEHIYRTNVDGDIFFTIDFSLLNDNERYDAIHTLMYDYSIKPNQIKFISDEHK